MSTKTGSSKKRSSRVKTSLEKDLDNIILNEPRLELEIVKTKPTLPSQIKPDKDLIRRKKRGRQIYERFRKYTQEHQGDPLPVGNWSTDSEDHWIERLKEIMDKNSNRNARFGMVSSVEFGLNTEKSPSLRLSIMLGAKEYSSIEILFDGLEKFLSDNSISNIGNLYRSPCIVSQDCLQQNTKVQILAL